MAERALLVEGLGKQYRLGAREASYRTLRDAVADAFLAPVRRVARPFRARVAAPPPSRPTIWALKDVSFEVAPGEMVGIIGKNGAGKSTLLKILSRVTEPTEGSVEIRGRVGSLLEVGTGFHPELTGRENVILSGAILGMRRAELTRKFDEIVAFSEVSEFLDTPVKHYSSGMFVRLAFAVAAHLDPDILLVDEVLAVGDAAFQRKCVGKMLEVGRGGRTVLFVSHNLGMVNALCGRALLLRDGRVAAAGATEAVIARYLESGELRAGVALEDRTDRSGNGVLRFTEMQVLDAEGQPVDVVMSGQRVRVRLAYRAAAEAVLENVFFQVLFGTLFGQNLFVCLTRACGGNFARLPAAGRIVCEIPVLPLAPGSYRLSLTGKVAEVIADELTEAAHLTVIAGDFFGSGRLPPSSSGPILVQHRWLVDGEPAALAGTSGDPAAAARY